MQSISGEQSAEFTRNEQSWDLTTGFFFVLYCLFFVNDSQGENGQVKFLQLVNNDKQRQSAM